SRLNGGLCADSRSVSRSFFDDSRLNGGLCADSRSVSRSFFDDSRLNGGLCADSRFVACSCPSRTSSNRSELSVISSEFCRLRRKRISIMSQDTAEKEASEKAARMQQPTNTRIYFGGLASSVTDAVLQSESEEFGETKECTIIRD
ncbi:hypothetical protein PFISCL1PPCAC_4056, partial [Pristionchus fissidentatus]